MSGEVFHFKQFSINQDKCSMKVGTDAVLLGAWANIDGVESALDIGTGSGVIALMLAQRMQNAFIDAIDIDKGSFEQASENFANSVWSKRLKCFQSSLQNFAIKFHNKYDLIISNPPFFISSSKSIEESRTTARHADLLPYKELVNAVVTLLKKDGKFCVILPIKESETFIELANQNKLYLNKLSRVRTKADKLSEKRWLMQFEFTSSKFSEDTIVIEDSQPFSYTREYKILTKDFYLNF